jgi:hypothetical protein
MKKLSNLYLYTYLFLVRKKFRYFSVYFFKYLNLKYLYEKVLDFDVCKDEDFAFWYTVKKSNQFIFYYTDFETPDEYFAALSLRNQLMQKGKKTGWVFFNEFLIFLKFNYYLTGIFVIIENFLEAITLPYKLYIVKFSNRNYYFPGPILAEKEQLAFIRKAFNTGIRKQHDIKYINRFFMEIIAFLNKSTDSILLQILNNIIDQGLENRAFIHYRWQLHKRH